MHKVKKVISFFLVSILILGSLLTMNVSAKYSFFTGENGVIVFTEDFEDYDSGVDIIDAIGDYWFFEDSNGLNQDSSEFCLVENDKDGYALHAGWILGRLVKSTDNLIIKSPFVLGGRMKALGEAQTKHGTHIWIRSTISVPQSEGGKNLREYEADENENVGGYGLAVELPVSLQLR